MSLGSVRNATQRASSSRIRARPINATASQLNRATRLRSGRFSPVTASNRRVVVTPAAFESGSATADAADRQPHSSLSENARHDDRDASSRWGEHTLRSAHSAKPSGDCPPMDRSPRRRGHRGLQSIQLRRKGQKRHKARTYVGLPRSRSTVVSPVRRSGDTFGSFDRPVGSAVSPATASASGRSRSRRRRGRARTGSCAPRTAAVTDEEHRAAAHPRAFREQRRNDGAPQHGAEQQGQLHVAHAEAAGEGEREASRNADAPSAAPIHAAECSGRREQAGGENESRRRQDDAVRQPARLDVDQ